MNLYKYYLRFLIWLGAEPPVGYEDIHEKHNNKENLDLSSWPSLKKAKRYNLLKIVIFFPIFLFLMVSFFLAGDWRTGIMVAGVLAGVILFAASFLFQALVVLLGAIYLFSQGHWLIGLVLLALTGYLIFAATLRDRDIVRSFTQVSTISPQAYKLLNEHISQRNNPFKIFNNKYPKMFLIILGIIAVIYVCQALIVIASLIFNLPCPDAIVPNMFCNSR
ncbi:MAG: hypothetical protein GX451_03330 [Acholeplasmataceae bacterium]|nr:hypothetical protein [Acholeplasmataceae bacterium]